MRRSQLGIKGANLCLCIEIKPKYVCAKRFVLNGVFHSHDSFFFVYFFFAPVLLTHFVECEQCVIQYLWDPNRKIWSIEWYTINVYRCENVFIRRRRRRRRPQCNRCLLLCSSPCLFFSFWFHQKPMQGECVCVCVFGGGLRDMILRISLYLLIKSNEIRSIFR